MTSKQQGMQLRSRSTMSSETGSRRRRGKEESCRRLIPGLPDELSLICLARVSLAQQAVLGRVCSSWRRLLQGRILYDIRQELSLTEEWLFLWTQDLARANVWHGYDPKANRWFTLPPLPNEQRTAANSASAVVDGKLFVVGGQLDNGNACNCVSYFDMHLYCWKSATPLNIPRAKCMAGAINNQLYVVGGFSERDQDAGPTAEAYNPVSNQWRRISSMKMSMELYDSAILDNKFYVVNSSSENLVGLVYDPKSDEWEYMAHGLNTGWQSKTAAMDGKLYAVGDSHSVEGKNEISVYNGKKDCWETVKGVLEDTAPVLGWGPELVSLCGRLYIVGTGLQPRIGTSRAAFAVVEVQESKTESSKASASLQFYEDITAKIEFADPLPRERVKSCHSDVLALHCTVLQRAARVETF